MSLKNINSLWYAVDGTGIDISCYLNSTSTQKMLIEKIYNFYLNFLYSSLKKIYRIKQQFEIARYITFCLTREETKKTG